jgi:hypothetical protein
MGAEMFSFVQGSLPPMGSVAARELDGPAAEALILSLCSGSSGFLSARRQSTLL